MEIFDSIASATCRVTLWIFIKILVTFEILNIYRDPRRDYQDFKISKLARLLILLAPMKSSVLPRLSASNTTFNTLNIFSTSTRRATCTFLNTEDQNFKNLATGINSRWYLQNHQEFETFGTLRRNLKKKRHSRFNKRTIQIEKSGRIFERAVRQKWPESWWFSRLFSAVFFFSPLPPERVDETPDGNTRCTRR